MRRPSTISRRGCSRWPIASPAERAAECYGTAVESCCGADECDARDDARRPRSVRDVGAVAAGAEHLHGVADVGESVLAGDRCRPGLDGRALDLDGASALAADQVVMVAL